MHTPLVDSDHIYFAAWGMSAPLAVPKIAQLMLKWGIPEEHIRAVYYSENTLAAYGQRRVIKAEDCLNLYERIFRSVVRGLFFVEQELPPICFVQKKLPPQISVS